jgi:hypothetical protein
VISTSWNAPPEGCDTTTNAGDLLTIPAAQPDRQLFTITVPLPIPPLLPQVDHVTAEIETLLPAQPM